MTQNHYLLDTNILIDYLKNKEESVNFFNNLLIQPTISVITVAELYAGIRKNEEKQIKHFLNVFKIIPVDNKIAKQGGLYRNQYFKSHNVCLMDGLLAATAEINNLKLITHNIKHFPMINNIESPY